MSTFETLACLDDYEIHASAILPKSTLDFYKSGAGSQETLKENIEAFQRLKIRPRFLRDVSKRDSSVSVLSEKISVPFGIAPTALQKLAHPDGEIASVKAAEKMGTIFIMSTTSTSKIEEVANAAPKCLKWFQLYVFKDRKLTEKLIKKAENSGFKALVVTVDLPVLGIRRDDARNNFFLPSHLTYANFEDVTQRFRNEQSDGNLKNFTSDYKDSSLNWKDIEWMKSITKLPIILKGIMTAEDAVLAVKNKVSGIIVSNHGGRQLDGTHATIEVLEEIVESVGDEIEVYFDGGIRNGADVFKALALGAQMVFIGRPALWGLAHSGEDGVRNVLKILGNEFDTTLALTGCCSVNDIKREMVSHGNHGINSKL